MHAAPRATQGKEGGSSAFAALLPTSEGNGDLPAALQDYHAVLGKSLGLERSGEHFDT